jgi:prepilin-type N-terminal cleavage/methylation domain-containing protein/prepilin-type processing-associated H-X9-DG protein
MRHAQVRAFTLIELLVVVAIMGVLTAILLPSLNKARDSARTVICANKMRQTGVMAAQYQADTKFLLPWLSTNFDPATPDGGVAANLRWSIGHHFTGILCTQGYSSMDQMVAADTAPSFYEAYWEKNLRKTSPFLCPSGKYFGNGTTGGATFGSWSQRDWPAGTGKWDTASVDIVDMHIANYPVPADKIFNTARVFMYTLSSYQVSRHTTITKVIGSISGQTPKKAIRQVADSEAVYLMEAFEDQTGRELDMDQEQPFNVYTNLISAVREFRIPHQDTANFLALDGHAGKVLRKHFGTNFKSERPCKFGELKPCVGGEGGEIRGRFHMIYMIHRNYMLA